MLGKKHCNYLIIKQRSGQFNTAKKVTAKQPPYIVN